MGVILAALALVLSMSITQSSQIQEQSTLQTEVRGALDTMASELRQAYTGDTTYPIETATATTLQFLSPDRAAPFHDRRIAYRLAGGQIDRAETTSTDTDGPPWVGLAWTSFGSIPTSAWSKQVGSVSNVRRVQVLRQVRHAADRDDHAVVRIQGRRSPSRSRRRLRPPASTATRRAQP